MKEIRGNMWDLTPQYDAVCITTNGYVKYDGSAVMGRGCARQAWKMFPGIEYRLGRVIQTSGLVVEAINEDPLILSFPVKPASRVISDLRQVVRHKRQLYHIGATVPGWACVADLEIIANSAFDLALYANTYELKKVLLPRPGCGAGELLWADVRPVLEKWLDDRFTCVTY